MSSSSSRASKKSKSLKKAKSSKNTEEDHVRVAIRVRPFNSREKRKGCKLCCSMTFCEVNLIY